MVIKMNNIAPLLPRLFLYTLRKDPRAYAVLRKMGIRRSKPAEKEREMMNFIDSIEPELLDISANGLPCIVYGFGDEAQEYSSVITVFLQSKNIRASHNRIDVRGSELEGFRKRLSDRNNNLAVDALYSQENFELFGEKIGELDYIGESAYIVRFPEPRVGKYTERDLQRIEKAKARKLT